LLYDGDVHTDHGDVRAFEFGKTRWKFLAVMRWQSNQIRRGIRMSKVWVLSMHSGYGLDTPDPIRSENARLEDLLKIHCRGPYDVNGIDMRFDAIVEGKTGSRNPRTGIRTYPFAKNLLCAEINISKADWEVPLDSYRSFLWLNVDKAIWICVEKLKKKKISFDADRLLQHLSIVRTEFLGKNAEPDAALRSEPMPVDVYPDDELYPVVIQYRIEGHGTMQDYDRRVKIETLLDDFLSEFDLGYLDGGDIGSGTVNVFCFVKPRREAAEAIIETLRKNNLLNGAVIAETVKGKEKVIWPPTSSVNFSSI
jgi:hypothetical protein